jgi:hypothetical protein
MPAVQIFDFGHELTNRLLTLLIYLGELGRPVGQLPQNSPSPSGRDVPSRSEFIKQKPAGAQLSGDFPDRYGICRYEHPN